MKYLIQIFVESEPRANVGYWRNTAWGSDDLTTTNTTAEKIALDNRMGIRKIRVVEVIKEFIAKT